MALSLNCASCEQEATILFACGKCGIPQFCSEACSRQTNAHSISCPGFENANVVNAHLKLFDLIIALLDETNSIPICLWLESVARETGTAVTVGLVQSGSDKNFFAGTTAESWHLEWPFRLVLSLTPIPTQEFAVTEHITRQRNNELPTIVFFVRSGPGSQKIAMGVMPLRLRMDDIASPDLKHLKMDKTHFVPTSPTPLKLRSLVIALNSSGESDMIVPTSL